MARPPKTSEREILEAAIDIIETDGLESLAMRAVARRLGLSINALYYYFPSRRALESAVAEEGERRLYTSLDQAAKWERHDPQILDRVCVAYLKFAREHAAIYDLFWTRNFENATSLLVREFRARYVETLWQTVGRKNAATVAYGLFALTHGLFKLEQRQQAKDGGAVNRMLREIIDAMVVGFAAAQSPASQRAVMAKTLQVTGVRRRQPRRY